MRSLLLALIGLSLLGAQASAKSSLRIGLQDDPDLLDPHRARTYVSRVVFTALCDKLVDATADFKIVPRLATSWTLSADGLALTFTLRAGVTFHDGEVFDAAAVKFNIDRALTMPESVRKSEIESIDRVEVIDPQTVTFRLKHPDATLLAQMTDRPGMMLAPKATAAGNVPGRPICSGPYKFVQRVQNDRIVLERFADYWNKDKFDFDELTFFSIPDATVRFDEPALRRTRDMIERLAASDVATARNDRQLAVVSTPGLGYNAVVVNIANGPQAKTPAGMDARVRQAFSMAIDRDTLNKAVFEGLYTPGDQPFPPTGPYHLDVPALPHDISKAKELLKAAGVATPVKVNLTVPSSSMQQQVGQVIQAMTSEAGFDVNLITKEFATLLKDEQQGNFEMSLGGWSGRIDPDGNIHQFVTCNGSFDDSHYCNKDVDRYLNEARLTSDEAKRKALYGNAWTILHADLPFIYLYFEPRIFAMTNRLKGFTPNPDGMIRLEGVKLSP